MFYPKMCAWVCVHVSLRTRAHQIHVPIISLPVSVSTHAPVTSARHQPELLLGPGFTI